MTETAANGPRRAARAGRRRIPELARLRAARFLLAALVLAAPSAARAQFSRLAPPPPAPTEGPASEPYGLETPRNCSATETPGPCPPVYLAGTESARLPGAPRA